MIERPYTLIAELTYRCPLRCPYCSNPTALRAEAAELTTEEWCRIFAEAEAIGVMQVHFTGGEPLVRRDLERLVGEARGLGLYTNLITSGLPLSRERLTALRDAGLHNVQLSIQDSFQESADRIAGRRSFEHKLEVAAWITAERLPLTINVVLHRDNIDHTPGIIQMAERLGASRLELANTRYLGWALINRAALLPSRSQLQRALAAAEEAKVRLTGKMEVVYVTPDYHASAPRACMEGWARRYLHIEPGGRVLPCHAAHTLPALEFENARDRSLSWIWHHAPSMNRFRGEGWMAEPCKSCPERAIDYGGCRCQVYHLTGDAAATDPACSLSPAHSLIQAARTAAEAARSNSNYVYRRMPVGANHSCERHDI